MSPVKLPVVASPSRTETACRCFRRHWLADVVNRSSYISGALSFGTVVHEGVGAFWDEGGPAGGMDAYNAGRIIIQQFWRNLRPDGAKHTLDMAYEIFYKYNKTAVLGGPFAGEFELVDIEKRHELEIDGRILSFKMDRVVRNVNTGRYAILDLKTASRINDKWHKTWDRSLQMKLYKYGAQQVYGGPVDVAIEGFSKEMPVRMEYHVCPSWSDAQLEEAVLEWSRQAGLEEEMLTLALDRAMQDPRFDPDNAEIQEVLWREYAEKLGVSPEIPFNYGDCYAYFFECPYYEICMAPPEMRYNLLTSDYNIIGSDLENV